MDCETYVHAHDLRPGDQFTYYGQDRKGQVFEGVATIAAVSCRVAYDNGFRGWDDNGLKPYGTTGIKPCILRNPKDGGMIDAEIIVHAPGRKPKTALYCFEGGGYRIHR